MLKIFYKVHALQFKIAPAAPGYNNNYFCKKKNQIYFSFSQNFEISCTQPVKNSLLTKKISIEEQILGKDFSDYQLNRLKQIFETSAWHLENYDKCEKKNRSQDFKHSAIHNQVNRAS